VNKIRLDSCKTQRKNCELLFLRSISLESLPSPSEQLEAVSSSPIPVLGMNIIWDKSVIGLFVKINLNSHINEKASLKALN